MWCLGIDTSNYTTSAALYNQHTGEVRQQKLPLPVPAGQIGLRQNDAVFLHVKQLGGVLDKLLGGLSDPIAAVGVSARPTDAPGSYMPCFLSGQMAAQAIAAALHVPLHEFSHQAGHVMAALLGVDKPELLAAPFVAFHVSGGTTQCLFVSPGEGAAPTIKLIAETLDLNAGQVVDRVGGLLNLPFPAGPGLEELAAASSKQYSIRPAMKGANCCLSGVQNQCEKMLRDGEQPADIARYCLGYIAAALLAMTDQVAADHPGLPLVYAGGVMGNRYIQNTIGERFAAHFAPPAFSADNAAGTAALAARAARAGREQAC